VLDEINESSEALPAVDRQIELCGEAPENFLSDGGNASGTILAGMEERGINAVVLVKSTEPAADNPARRDDLSQPVPEDQWDKHRSINKCRLSCERHGASPMALGLANFGNVHFSAQFMRM
jgi:hypothetical protein